MLQHFVENQLRTLVMLLLTFLVVVCVTFVHTAQGQLQCTLTSDDCKNKYCLMMESFFTCEVMDDMMILQAVAAAPAPAPAADVAVSMLFI